MRITFRARCPHVIKNCLLQCLALSVVGIRLCRQYVYILLGVMFVVLFVWWSTVDSAGCDGSQIINHVCEEYIDKYTSGNLCHDLCISKQLRIHSCYSYKDNIKSYRSGHLIFKAISNPDTDWKQDRIQEGVQSTEFLEQVSLLLQHELGHMDTSLLINQLVLDFDTNQDGKIDLGEAQNMWWVLKQPDFLNLYIFQDTTAVPHLNGTCGGISMWYYQHLKQGSTLYRKNTPWPISLFTSHAYRWTLPSWTLRAKVMLSLAELAEELYEKSGVRYHLCNINGLTLYHHSGFEVVITEDTMLLSSQQISNRLSNITCRYAHDCTLTPQCRTTCDFSTRQCTGKVIRPTIAIVCDIMEDYLLFDAPKLVKMSLTRLLHRCQGMTMYTQKLDLVHSILVLDLKSLLWNYIQNKLK